MFHVVFPTKTGESLHDLDLGYNTNQVIRPQGSGHVEKAKLQVAKSQRKSVIALLKELNCFSVYQYVRLPLIVLTSASSKIRRSIFLFHVNCRNSAK